MSLHTPLQPWGTVGSGQLDWASHSAHHVQDHLDCQPQPMASFSPGKGASGWLVS